MKIENPPSPREFFENTTLYKSYRFGLAHIADVVKILFYKGTYDAYCIECKKESTFKVSPAVPISSIQEFSITLSSLMKQGLDYNAYSIGSFFFKSECARNPLHIHVHTAVLRKTEEEIDGAVCESSLLIKAGQYPSTADLDIAKYKRYSKVLGREQYKEFSKAIGLAAHGVGIGAFVYLRRILESLVETAHVDATTDANWNEEKYKVSVMGERIKLLREHLPKFLIDNSNMYGLLSKGLHELSEDECNAHFHTLRICVELVLDEKIERRLKEQKIAEARSSLSRTTNALSKNDS